MAGRQYLVDAKNGEAAARQVQRHYEKLGLKGVNSSHSLRASLTTRSKGVKVVVFTCFLAERATTRRRCL
jgi:hypothetical protein